jgi:hypothetical protein
MKCNPFSFGFVLTCGIVTIPLAAAIPGHTQHIPGEVTPEPASPTDGLTESQILFNAPTPPSQGTPGGRSQGGASRGPCQDYQDLAALVPTTEGIVWGKTAQSNPSLWFYLPQAITAETPMEFILQDADDNYVYSNNLEDTEIPAGLIQFEIAPEAQPLQPDHLYTWTLVIYCDPAQPTESVFVNGILQPTSLDPALQSQLTAAEELDQAKLYATSGIWYDALNTLAEYQQTQPANPLLSKAWEDLLRQAGLDEFATQSFSPCCSF